MMDVKKKIPAMWKNNLTCRTCKDDKALESQEHLMSCPEITKHVDIPTNLKYTDIFRRVDKQLEVVKVYKEIVRQREFLLNCSE